MPLSLVTRISELLGYWDAANYDRAVQDERDVVLCAIDAKMRALELRDAYAKIIAADGEDSRRDARIGYLRMKACLLGMSGSDCAD